MPGAPEAGDDLVEDQHDVVPIAQVPERRQVALRRDPTPAVIRIGSVIRAAIVSGPSSSITSSTRRTYVAPISAGSTSKGGR